MSTPVHTGFTLLQSRLTPKRLSGLSFSHVAWALIWTCSGLVFWQYWQTVAAGGDAFRNGDWLINFAGGPVRRGFLGETILWLSKISGQSPLVICYFLQTATWTGILLGIQALYFSHTRSREWAWLILSPAFLLFPYFDNAGGLRKEILAYLSFVVLCSAWVKGQSSQPRMAISLLLFGIATAAHEGNAFFVPFFWWMLERNKTEESAPTNQIWQTAFMATSAAAIILASLYPGTKAAEHAVCQALIERNIDPSICTGAIAWIGRDLNYSFHHLGEFLTRYFIYYPPLLVLSLMPLYQSGWLTRHWRPLLLAFMATIPLYAVAVDWGRWIAAYVFFAIVAMLAEPAPVAIRWTRWSPQMAAVLVLTWHLPHYAADGLSFGWAGKVVRTLARLLHL